MHWSDLAWFIFWWFGILIGLLLFWSSLIEIEGYRNRKRKAKQDKRFFDKIEDFQNDFQ
jgi:hypothetical protein